MSIQYELQSKILYFVTSLYEGENHIQQSAVVKALAEALKSEKRAHKSFWDCNCCEDLN